MASLSLSLTTSQGTVSAPVTIADSDISRIMLFLAAAYQNRDNEGNPTGDTSPFDLVKNVGAYYLNDLLMRVHQFEQQQAFAAAAASVSPISVIT